MFSRKLSTIPTHPAICPFVVALGGLYDHIQSVNIAFIHLAIRQCFAATGTLSLEDNFISHSGRGICRMLRLCETLNSNLSLSRNAAEFAVQI